VTPGGLDPAAMLELAEKDAAYAKAEHIAATMQIRQAQFNDETAKSRIIIAKAQKKAAEKAAELNGKGVSVLETKAKASGYSSNPLSDEHDVDITDE